MAFWQREVIRCLDAIERETTQSLDNIQAHYEESGLAANHEFKINFLKTVNYRLMETYKRFEMSLSVEKFIRSTAFGPNNNNDEDTHMLESDVVKNNSHKEPVYPDVIGNTPFMVANTPTIGVQHGVDDMLKNMQTPILHNHFQSEVVPRVRTTGTGPKTRREWICYTCKEDKRRNMFYTSIDEVYDHWYLEHSGYSNTPFRFYSNELMNCNKCRYISTFFSLQKHHNTKHPYDIFVPLQNDRCALCLDGNNITTHSCKELEKVQKLKLFNPVVYTEDTVADLLELNRKFECKHCQSLFDTSQDIMAHHHKEHRQLAIEVEKTEMKRIVGLVCGCCHHTISAGEHVAHLKSVAYKRWSNMVTWEEWFQQFEMDYLRTKVIFGNGLVVFKQNLIATDLGGSPGYKHLAQELFKEFKKM